MGSTIPPDENCPRTAEGSRKAQDDPPFRLITVGRAGLVDDVDLDRPRTLTIADDEHRRE